MMILTSSHSCAHCPTIVIVLYLFNPQRVVCYRTVEGTCKTMMEAIETVLYRTVFLIGPQCSAEIMATMLTGACFL
jgi:hypothetical protein